MELFSIRIQRTFQLVSTAMLHISSRTLQKLRDEKGIAYTAIGGKFLYPLSKLQLLLEENYRSYVR